MNRKILILVFLLTGWSVAEVAVTSDVSGVLSRGLFEKSWLRFGVGTYLDGEPLGLLAGSIAIAPRLVLRGDLDIHTNGGGVSLSAMPTIAYSFTDQLKDPSMVNPYLRGGLQVWHYNPERGNSDTGFHLVLGGGAEILLGPQVLFDPYLLVFLWDGNHAVIGFDGNYLVTSDFAIGLGFSMDDVELHGARVQATATLAF